MKRSRYSPASASMICSSRPVPRVTVTSACVSPLVNSAEPWVRGSTPTRTLIGRTVRVSRPSIRGSPSRIWLRTIFDSVWKKISFTSLTLGLDSTGAVDSIRLDVPLTENSEDVDIAVSAYGSGVTWYTGTTTATLVNGQTVVPPALTLTYVGLGANADSVRVQLPLTRLVGGIGATLTAAVYVPGGLLTGVPVGFRSGDSGIARVSSQTLNTALLTGRVPVRDSTWVYAELPTHLLDSIRVAVVPPPASLVLASGNAQTGPVGVALAAPLCVHVLDMLNGPFEGQPVTWGVTSGGGTLSASVVPSDAGGLSCVTLTPTALGAITARAAAAGLTGSPVAFTETVAGARQIQIVSGNSQSDTVGAVLAPFVVQVTDAQSNPVAGAKVAWLRIAGTGTVSADTTVTDAAGLTQITYTLGATPGADQVRATLVGSTANVVFDVTVSAGAVRSVTLAQLNDTIPKGATLQYAATARDVAGNVVPVTFAWSSTAPGVASVNTSGLATAQAGGNAKIVAAYGAFADTADLWVRALTTIAVSTDDTVITAVGDSLLLRAAALDNFGDTVTTGVALIFISATPTFATVNAVTGRVNIIGPGNAVVVARDTVSGVQGPATLRVNQVPFSVANVPADSILVGVSGRAQITARALDRNLNPIPGRTLGWSSRNPAIFTTDQFGVVTGIALGSAYVVDRKSTRLNSSHQLISYAVFC